MSKKRGNNISYSGFPDFTRCVPHASSCHRCRICHICHPDEACGARDSNPEAASKPDVEAPPPPSWPPSLGTTFSSILTSDTIKIVVPSANVTYTAHDSILRQKSEYFRRLFSSGLKESQTGMVTLKDEDVDKPQAIEAFLQYCYLGDYSGKSTVSEDLLLQAQIYIFAERIQCQDLKTVALKKAALSCQKNAQSGDSAIKEFSRTVEQIIPLIYGNTSDRAGSVTIGRAKDLNPVAHTERGAGRLFLYVDSYGSLGTVQQSEKRQSVTSGSIARDGFRMLLAAYSAANLDMLRTSAEFMNLHHSLNDFSSDLILFVGRGNQIILNSDGTLKIGFEMIELS